MVQLSKGLVLPTFIVWFLNGYCQPSWAIQILNGKKCPLTKQTIMKNILKTFYV
jgi:hypothetical protein